MFRAAFSAKYAPETAHRGYAILPGLRASTRAPESLSRPLKYSKARPQKLFGDFVQLTHSAFAGEDERQAEDSRALWSRIINVWDGRCDRSDWDPERARYVLMHELVMGYLDSNGSRVRGAHTWASMDGLLDWLAFVFDLDDMAVLPCSFARTGGKVLGTRRRAAEQTKHNDSVVRGGKSPKYCFVAIVEVGAHLYVTPSFHLCLH